MTGPVITRHAIPAERALLGILMETPQLAESCGVMPGDLCPEMGHPEILGAIVSVYEDKGTVDPILVTQELIRRDHFTRIGESREKAGVYLFELVQAGHGAGTVGHYSLIIREATTRRTLHEIGTRLASTAASSGDLDVVLDNAAELAMRLGLVIDTPIDSDAPIPGLGTFEAFVDEPSPAHNWVIPGILERQDRVMLVADEGSGKSVLARQMCTLLAAGRHPFMPGQKILPRRTLLIDLENPPDLVRRGLRGLVGQVREEGLELDDRAWRWTKPAGMDLRSPVDRQLMVRVIELARPDFVSIGPLYKASLGRSGEDYESAAQGLAVVFDQLRQRYGFALWIEHHMPKGDAQGHRSGPIGSSYWMRWPEFGLMLKWSGDEEPNVYNLGRFRGDRDVRAWPSKLIKRAGRWPWTPDWDDAEVQQNLYDAIDEEKVDLIQAERRARETPPEPAPNRADIAGSGIQHSAPWTERYTPERDEDDSGASGLSNPSSQTVNAGPQGGPGAPDGVGSVPVGPHSGTGHLSGSDNSPQEPDFDDTGWEDSDDGADPIF